MNEIVEETIEAPVLQSVPDAPEPEVEYHTILEVWREVLKPAAAESKKRVSPAWASRICSSYGQLEFSDMSEFQSRYFSKVLELTQILEDEIKSDDEALQHTSPEEDAAENREHYKALLTDWQKAILQWELDWNCTDPNAAAELAAISEAHKMFFGEVGVVAFLDNIGFEFNESDQQEVADALEALKEAQ